MFDLLIAFCLYSQVACRQQQIINYAVLSAQTHNIDSNKFLMLISCESRFDEKAKGDFRSETSEYMANGLLQMWEDTFNHFSQIYKIKGRYKELNPFTQIDISILMIRDGYVKRWYNCGLASGLIENKNLTKK
ncbi:MAG: transglycosylase SLT domain-containing protein [Nanoarchaeota archaeon]